MVALYVHMPSANVSGACITIVRLAALVVYALFIVVAIRKFLLLYNIQMPYEIQLNLQYIVLEVL